VTSHAGALRRAFDEAFARPVTPVSQDGTDCLIVVAGAETCAIRVSELAGLAVDRRITPVPREGRGLLGLCAVHGTLVPVFDLCAMLGAEASGPSPRWIALHRDTELVGLAFTEWLETRRIAPHDVRPLAPEHASRSRHAIRVDQRIIHVVDIPAVVSTIRQTFARR
jgi:chemotaxis signal transduction protein